MLKSPSEVSVRISLEGAALLIGKFAETQSEGMDERVQEKVAMLRKMPILVIVNKWYILLCSKEYLGERLKWTTFFVFLYYGMTWIIWPLFVYYIYNVDIWKDI